MATTSPARIEDELYASAKLAGDALSRSASQQIAHWARIGREIQASASISHREIAGVLAGRVAYDTLDPKEQAVVRAEWAERMAVYREDLDLAERFAAAGRTWVELDDDGRVVERAQPVVKPSGTAAKAVKTSGKAAAVKTAPAVKAAAVKTAPAVKAATSVKAPGKSAAKPRAVTSGRSTRSRAAR